MENNKEEEFKVPQINSEKDLDTIFSALYDQGFGYVQNQDRFHKNKIEKLIQKYNTLRVDVPQSFYSDSYKIKNYSEADNVISSHFSKIKPDDKIFELIKSIFSLKFDDRAKLPQLENDNIIEVIEWFKFKERYNLNDKDFKSYIHTRSYTNVDVYNFDKKFIKISFGKDSGQFETFYNLIFNEKCKEVENKVGAWQDLGKIEIKQFLNGTANIRGDIDKIKEYYYNELITHTFYNNLYIIYYNKNIKIVTPKDYK